MKSNTPELQLNPCFESGIPLDDIPNLTDEQIEAIFPNFVPVWRGFLRELAAQQAENESA